MPDETPDEPPIAPVVRISIRDLFEALPGYLAEKYPADVEAMHARFVAWLDSETEVQDEPEGDL